MMAEKKKVGMVVAIEMEAFFELYADYEELDAPCGFKMFRVETKAYDLYVIQSGMGEIAASAAVQHLISGYGVSVIINFGVVGGLTEDMKLHKVCLVDRVVHYKYDVSKYLGLAIGQVDGHDSIFLKPSAYLVKRALEVDSSLPTVTCCSADQFVDSAEDKKYIHETFSGDICDMESAGIVLACEMNNVPCLLLKAVSDGLMDGAAGFIAELNNAAVVCLTVAKQVIEEIVFDD